MKRKTPEACETSTIQRKTAAQLFSMEKHLFSITLFTQKYREGNGERERVVHALERCTICFYPVISVYIFCVGVRGWNCYHCFFSHHNFVNSNSNSNVRCEFEFVSQYTVHANTFEYYTYFGSLEYNMAWEVFVHRRFISKLNTVYIPF